MSKTLIVSTSSIDDELRGATLRLKTLNSYFNIGEKYIYVPTLFKKGSVRINEINIKFFPITIIDIAKMPYFIFQGLPLSNLIYRRVQIKKNLHMFDRVIFHLIRTIQDYNKPSTITVDMCESLSKNFLMRAETMNKISLKRILFIHESKKLKKYELEICSLGNEKKLFISENDELVRKCINYEILPNIPAFKSKQEMSLELDYKKVVFIGHVDYEPNLISIKDTSLLLKSIDSKIRLHVVGRYNKNTKSFLSSFKNVILHGFVDEVDEVFKNAICGFALIKNCTGMQNKVIDYFSYSLPCIVSNEVQDGLPGKSPAIVCETIDQIENSLKIFLDINERKKLIEQGHNYLKNIRESFVAKREKL